MGRPSLSLCMIVRDVEKTIGQCLASVVPHVDEVVITDTGSLDGTKLAVYDACPHARVLDFNASTNPEAFLPDVSETWGGKVPGPFLSEPLLADYAAARNHGWRQATGDYVMWIDSDDVLVGGDRLRDVVAQMEREVLDFALLNYDYDSDHLGRPILSLQRERIMRRSFGSGWCQPIHENLFPNGNARLFEEVNVVHKRTEWKTGPRFAFRNLKVLLHWAKKNRQDPNLDARMLFYLAMEERFLWPDQAVLDFGEYCHRSGWDEERALAHKLCGDLHEQAAFAHPGGSADRARRFSLAMAEYAQIEIEYPWNLDGLRGCARISYYQHAWEKTIDLCRRCLEAARTRTDRKLQTPNNPHQAKFEPYVYLSVALFSLGRFREVVEACDLGLAHAPDDPHLLGNKAEALKHLEGPVTKDTVKFNRAETLDAPAMDLPREAAVNFAVQLWKQLRDKEGAARAVAFAMLLPADLRTDPRIERLLSGGGPPGLSIAFWIGPSWEPWTPDSLKTGIGGSETAAIHMAKELARLGHVVTVYAEVDGTWDGVQYVDHRKHPATAPDVHVDVLVLSRGLAGLDRFHARQRFLWVHDIHVGGGAGDAGIIDKLNAVDVIFCLSNWHKEFFLQHYGYKVPSQKVYVTRNGIDPARFAEEPAKPSAECIYASSADRGLERLLDLFPTVRARVPWAKLHVCYGMKLWKDMAGADLALAHRISILQERIDVGVAEGWLINHGRIGQRELAELYARCKVLAYPTWFTETYCISALEAQAAGCVPVTTDLAALFETAARGVLIAGSCATPEYGLQWVDAVVEILTDDAKRAAKAAPAREWALGQTWAGVAAEWATLFTDRAREAAASAAQPTPVVEVKAPPMRLAFAYGLFSSQIHGPFDIPGLYTTRGLTGSESSFFNMVRELSSRGHQVDVFADVSDRQQLGSANVWPLRQPVGSDYDAYISWNEPNHLRGVPARALRVVAQQLNDFRSYTAPGWDDWVDLYVMPSGTHRDFLCASEAITRAKTEVIPNSIDLSLVPPDEGYRHRRIIWASSPDRGLHVLLDMFPELRRRVPGVELDIFYRFDGWYDAVKDAPTETGRRARMIGEVFARLGRDGEGGIRVHGSVSNKRMLVEMSRAQVFAYTCEPMSFTEGFSVATLDACAAGCPALISNADAITEVHGGAAAWIAGKPSETVNIWLDQLTDILTDQVRREQMTEIGRLHAGKFSMAKVGDQWERLLRERLKPR